MPNPFCPEGFQKSVEQDKKIMRWDTAHFQTGTVYTSRKHVRLGRKGDPAGYQAAPFWWVLIAPSVNVLLNRAVQF